MRDGYDRVRLECARRIVDECEMAEDGRAARI